MQSILQQRGKEMCPSCVNTSAGLLGNRCTSSREVALEETSSSTQVAGSNPLQQQAGLLLLGKEDL